MCCPPQAFREQPRITAVRDPDGTLVEPTELGSSWLDHLKSNRAAGHDLVRTWDAHLGKDAL